MTGHYRGRLTPPAKTIIRDSGAGNHRKLAVRWKDVEGIPESEGDCEWERECLGGRRGAPRGALFLAGSSRAISPAAAPTARGDLSQVRPVLDSSALARVPRAMEMQRTESMEVHGSKSKLAEGVPTGRVPGTQRYTRRYYEGKTAAAVEGRWDREEEVREKRDVLGYSSNREHREPDAYFAENIRPEPPPDISRKMMLRVTEIPSKRRRNYEFAQQQPPAPAMGTGPTAAARLGRRNASKTGRTPTEGAPAASAGPVIREGQAAASPTPTSARPRTGADAGTASTPSSTMSPSTTQQSKTPGDSPAPPPQASFALPPPRARLPKPNVFWKKEKNEDFGLLAIHRPVDNSRIVLKIPCEPDKKKKATSLQAWLRSNNTVVLAMAFLVVLVLSYDLRAILF